MQSSFCIYLSRMILFFTIFSVLLVCCFTEETDFLVNTAQCQIPDLPAFSNETSPVYQNLPHIQCSGGADLLTYTTVKDNHGYLHIDESKVFQYYKSKEEVDCCYQYIFRNGSEDDPDVGIRFTDCLKLTSNPQRLDHDTVLVRCRNVYTNVHQVITVKSDVRKRLRKASGSKRLSVLLIVIDSVSRLNLIRTMPETRDFLLGNGFVEMRGYNKIDENTFPNFNAMLTGMNREQSNRICRPNRVGGLDACPMVWYDFRDEGYVTAYAEDWADIGTYVYMKKGFYDPPTDYYFKPYFEAAEITGMDVDSMPYCSGPEVTGERVFNLAKDFATTFQPHPSFGIFWMNTFSHNYLNTPSRMDRSTKNFFQDLKNLGILDESLVLLLSDHGMRFGPIVKTVQGWYEERTPVNLISVPPWFRQKYPGKYRNLLNNSGRLTSTYDLYMTFQEILAMSSEDYLVNNSSACQECKSLFSDIPEERSCEQTGLTEAWCACVGKFKANHEDITEELKRDAAKLVLGSDLENFVSKVIIAALSKTEDGKKYFLMVFQTNKLATYKVLCRVHGRPLQIKKKLLVLRVY